MLEAKKVIRQILLIYLTTTGVFLAVFFILWYQKLYIDLLRSKNTNLRDIQRTIVLSIANSKYTPIEQACKNISFSSGFKFAIVDDNKTLCSTLSFSTQNLNFNFRHNTGIYKDTIVFTAFMNLSNYYIQQSDTTQEDNIEGSLRTIIEGENVSKDLFFIRFKVLGFALLSFLGIALISYILVKIALKPLEDKIKTLNSFIKDFTHEINTPLSVILLTIERLEQQNKEIDSTKFSRMKLASKTLSQVYSDLIFYTFPDTLSKEEENLQMKNLIMERLEYFKLFFEQKNITLHHELDESVLFANRSKIAKIFDNLISNAIKYNKKSGSIDVVLKDNHLKIKDSGVGIDDENIKKIFERYTRFNKDQGGFGIGLSLVQAICKEYNIKITCTSKLGQGSEFCLSW